MFIPLQDDKYQNSWISITLAYFETLPSDIHPVWTFVDTWKYKKMVLELHKNKNDAANLVSRNNKFYNSVM